MEIKRTRVGFKKKIANSTRSVWGTCAYLNGSQLVILSRVVVHHNNKIVTDMSLLIATSFVALPVWHQCGDVKDSCAGISSFIIYVVKNKVFSCYPEWRRLVSRSCSPCMMSSCQQ